MHQLNSEANSRTLTNLHFAQAAVLLVANASFLARCMVTSVHSKFMMGVLCTAKKGEEALSLSTVQGVPQNGDGVRQMSCSCAWWLCRNKKKKKWSNKSPKQCTFEATTIRSKNLWSIHLGYLLIDECTWEKIDQIMQVTATESTALRQEKKVWCAWINLNKDTFNLFRLSNNLCCHWC